MSFSELDVTRRTRKGNFLKQIDINRLEPDRESDCGALFSDIRCDRATGVFWIAAVEDASGRDLEWWSKR